MNTGLRWTALVLGFVLTGYLLMKVSAGESSASYLNGAPQQNIHVPIGGISFSHHNDRVPIGGISLSSSTDQPALLK